MPISPTLGKLESLLRRITIGPVQALHKWNRLSLSWYRHIVSVLLGEPGEIEEVNTDAWQKTLREIGPPSQDFAFWWKATGPPLAQMLNEAQYDSKSQQSHLRFYSKYLAHRLGPRSFRRGQPNGWRSFVTDDFSPLEYSWSWNKGVLDAPKVRYTIEVIGSAAGSGDDPFNSIAAMDTAQAIAFNHSNVDLTWFNHFLSAFVDPSLPLPKAESSYAMASPSSVFLAFDLNREGEIGMKAYHIPLKAEQSGVTRLTIVSETVHALAEEFPAFGILYKFLSTHSLGIPTSIVGVGVDCVHPSVARLRLYVRSPDTSFENVCKMLALDGTIPTIRSEKALGKFRKLWHQLLSLPPDFSDSTEIQNADHETGGILYSFDVKPNNLLPEAKVYVPVKHYAKNDWEAFTGLKEFLEGEGKGQWVGGFGKVLQTVGSGRWREEVGGWEPDTTRNPKWKERRGMQTYVGVGFELEDLALTSYVAPGIYD